MKKYFFIALIAVLALTFIILAAQDISLSKVGHADANDSKLEEQITRVAGTEAAFNYLAEQQTNVCGLQPELVLDYSDDVRLQGSCCAPMDLHRYQEQVAALHQYDDLTQIPEDPYDMPATLVKELLGYQASIQLTSQQQAVYDRAMSLPEEGGPCCCRCWRWYAFEGMGKYLIAQRGWEAEALAALWSLTDGCGGEGHGHA